jgi:CRP-like cAMP-binding protein
MSTFLPQNGPDQALSTGEPRLLERGEYLYQPTDRPDTLYVVERGALKVGSYSPRGKEVTYDVLTQGELVGNLQYLPDNTFSEFARALTSVRVMLHPVRVFKKLVQQDIHLADEFHQMVVRRWCRAETRLFHVASLPPNQRVVQLLKQYPLPIIDVDGHAHTVRNLLTQQDIADLCGLTRQTTARILREFAIGATTL